MFFLLLPDMILEVCLVRVDVVTFHLDVHVSRYGKPESLCNERTLEGVLSTVHHQLVVHCDHQLILHVAVGHFLEAFTKTITSSFANGMVDCTIPF